MFSNTEMLTFHLTQVASQSLQLEVADFLLREGADIHAGDWAQNSPR